MSSTSAPPFTTARDVITWSCGSLSALGIAFAFRSTLEPLLFGIFLLLGLLHIAGYIWRHMAILAEKEGKPPATLGFPSPLESRWVLVTGGAHGLGKGIALSFLRMGYNVVVWDINVDAMTKFAKEWAAENPTKSALLRTAPCNVADEVDVVNRAAEVQRWIEAERPADRSLDVLVLNAGIVNGVKVVHSNPNAIRRIFGVNVCHLFNTSRAFLPDIYASVGTTSIHKSVVVIGSIAGYSGAAQLADYTASKGAANLFAESLAAECRDVNPNIVVSLICPNIINTGMFDGCKSLRFFPILQTERVVAAVIDAVRFRKQLVVIPWLMHVLYAVKSLVPYFVIFPHVDKLLGASTAMREFVPRSHGAMIESEKKSL